ncbi:S24 family peptidase [Dysgonomonas sp.]
MNELGENQNSFSKKIGVTPSTIATAFERNKGVNTDLIQKIINVFTNISTDWLLTGNGSMLKSNQVLQNTATLNEDKNSEISIYKLRTDYFGTDRQAIPLYELDAAAGLSSLFSSQVQQIPLDYITVPNAPKCDGALFVRGDSMYPILKSGDIICYKHIERLDDIYWGEMYLLDIDVSGDQYLTLKYVQKSDSGDEYVKLVSHNPHHNPKDISKKDIRAVALIKISIRYNTLS